MNNDNALSFDMNTWREELPLTTVDFVKDPNVKAAIAIFYVDIEDGNESRDTIKILFGAEGLSLYLLIGMLDAAKEALRKCCIINADEEDG